ncbi:MAG TPA: hypothetical protein VJJ22_05220 [Candidatus Paceibacterota bacterium]
MRTIRSIDWQGIGLVLVLGGVALVSVVMFFLAVMERTTPSPIWTIGTFLTLAAFAVPRARKYKIVKGNTLGRVLT